MTINPEFLQYYKQIVAAASTIPDYQTRQSKLKALNDYFQKATGTAAPSPLSQIPPNYVLQPSGVSVTSKGPTVKYIALSPEQKQVQDEVNSAKQIKSLIAQGNDVMGMYQRPVLTPAADTNFTVNTGVPAPGQTPSPNPTIDITGTKSGTRSGSDKIVYRPMNMSDISQGSNPFNSYDAQGRNVMYFKGGLSTPFDPLDYAHAVGIRQQALGMPTTRDGGIPLYDPSRMYDPTAATASTQQKAVYPAFTPPSLADIGIAQQSASDLVNNVPDTAAPSTVIDPRFKGKPADGFDPIAADLKANPPQFNIMVDPKNGTRYKVDASGTVLGAL